MKVANIRARVMAELASLVLSTSMDIITPTPMNANPTKNRMKNRISGLYMGTFSKFRSKIQIMLCNMEIIRIGSILPMITIVLVSGVIRRTSKVFLSRSPTMLSVTMLLAMKNGSSRTNGTINPYITSTK